MTLVLPKVADLLLLKGNANTGGERPLAGISA
jgi:hypothetical protein